MFALRCKHDEDRALVIHARLPAEEGPLVLKALEASRQALGTERGAPGEGDASAETTHMGDGTASDSEEEELDPETIERFTPSNADALVLMAQTSLAHESAGGVGDEHQVVVHVDAATLAHDDEGACELEPDESQRTSIASLPCVC